MCAGDHRFVARVLEAPVEWEGPLEPQGTSAFSGIVLVSWRRWRWWWGGVGWGGVDRMSPRRRSCLGRMDPSHTRHTPTTGAMCSCHRCCAAAAVLCCSCCGRGRLPCRSRSCWTCSRRRVALGGGGFGLGGLVGLGGFGWLGWRHGGCWGPCGPLGATALGRRRLGGSMVCACVCASVRARLLDA